MMLRATGRHPWRPAHIHFVVSAEGCLPLTTHVFDAESRYLETDAVFGYKKSLARKLVAHDSSRESSPEGIAGNWYTVDIDIVLQLAAAPTR